jgi:hypothetical protein
MKIPTRLLVVSVLWLCIGLHGAPPEAASPSSTLEQAADDAYEFLLDIFRSVPSDRCVPVKSEEFQCNYWQLGNAFDTVIDYLRMNRSKAETFAQVVISKYDLTAKTPWACWYDDFGWWAVAAQRAFEHVGLWSPDQTRRFQQIAAETWTIMQAGLSVWDHGQENFPDQKPKFEGGIWNYFWTSKQLTGVCNTPCDPTDFLNNNLCGRQNTVTNALYLNAAALRQGSGDLYYAQATTREREFLGQWFDPANFPDPSKSLLYALDPTPRHDGPAVVRERVSTYANGAKDPLFLSQLIWAGDQGLVLGGLLRSIDFSHPTPNERATLNLAKRITDGVRDYLSDGQRFFPWSNVQNPTPDQIGDPPSGDFSDYNTGIGVFLRYLLDAYRTNQEMRQHLQTTGYPERVRRFAEDFAAKDQGLCYPDETLSSCNDLVKYTNKLAAVMAALEMNRHGSLRRNRP